jgi:hypothetical protein
LAWSLASDEERNQSVLTPDQCELVAGGQVHHFIHALLRLPVRGRSDPLVLGVWCSQSEATYREVSALWESEERVRTGPHFGWLCNRVPGYPDSLHLKAHVHQQPVGFRPLVELEATDHPLAVDQHRGIEIDRVHRIAEAFWHASPPGSKYATDHIPGTSGFAPDRRDIVRGGIARVFDRLFRRKSP